MLRCLSDGQLRRSFVVADCADSTGWDFTNPRSMNESFPSVIVKGASGPYGLRLRPIGSCALITPERGVIDTPRFYQCVLSIHARFATWGNGLLPFSHRGAPAFSNDAWLANVHLSRVQAGYNKALRKRSALCRERFEDPGESPEWQLCLGREWPWFRFFRRSICRK